VEDPLLKKTPEIIDRIHELMEYETAGDPMSGMKWTRKTTENIAAELGKLNIEVSSNTVASLLREYGYSLRVNHKKIAISGEATPDTRAKRDLQFDHIKRTRKRFSLNGDPIISVDTKKKELIGNFKNNGKAWNKSPIPVNDHDFPSVAEGKAIPYGIYDVTANHGTVFVGTSHDTSTFASDCIGSWWKKIGCHRYPNSKKLLVLADNGGSNRPRAAQWLYGISENLCKRHGISVTVCHYPPGASKWNPIEHRLFSEISKNWAGVPLKSIETILKYIRTTCTKTGLRVKAFLVKKYYATKQKPTELEMETVKIISHKVIPQWNYVVKPN
jgi:hypothetical protein